VDHYKKNNYPKILFYAFFLIWILLAVNPTYRFDWFLENLLVFVVVPFTIYIHSKKFISNLSYSLIFIFLVLHVVGSHYTYSEVPAGKIISSWFGSQRNQYDRVVHFLCGLFLTLPVYEIVQAKVKTSRAWCFFTSFSIVSASGVIYELMEWAAAIIVNPQAGTAFLGTQGDEWDAQKDLSLKLLGSVFSLLVIAAYDGFTGMKRKK
jgi:putative membrane protein